MRGRTWDSFSGIRLSPIVDLSRTDQSVGIRPSILPLLSTVRLESSVFSAIESMVSDCRQRLSDIEEGLPALCNNGFAPPEFGLLRGAESLQFRPIVSA